MDTMALNLSSQSMSAQPPENVISPDETNFSPEALSKKRAQCFLEGKPGFGSRTAFIWHRVGQGGNYAVLTSRKKSGGSRLEK
jgi:hypothetical protein